MGDVAASRTVGAAHMICDVATSRIVGTTIGACDDRAHTSDKEYNHECYVDVTNLVNYVDERE